MKVSNCCFVKGEAWVSVFIRLDYEKAEFCPKCGEHCEYVKEETTSELPGVDNSQVKPSNPQMINFLKL